jgi:hypothetical protein
MPLTPGSTSIIAVTRTNITLQATPPTGGVGPYTYQWNRSTQYNFIPSAATQVPGQTSLTLNDSNLSENTPYYYVLIATDSTTPTHLTVSYPQTGVITNSPYVGSWIAPQIPQFQSYFVDDFPYGPDPKTQFPDYRILNAIQMIGLSFFNPDFFGDQVTFNIGYLLLSAHYMVMNIRRASQGMKGQFGFLQNSKSAGITVGIEIPQRIKDNPDFAWLCQTNYGAEYLHLILPQLSGQMYAIPRMTNP